MSQSIEQIGFRNILNEDYRMLLIACLRLTLEPPRPVPRPDHLRGAIASVAPELDLLHQHGQEGLIYRAPRVIYRIADRMPTIIAAAEGVDAVLALRLVGNQLKLGAIERRVLDATLTVAQSPLGATAEPKNYRFVSPWLALNQENYSRFQRMYPDQRCDFLDHQVVNNCLSLAKSYGVHVTERLTARTRLRSLRIWHKRVEMLGFLGSIEVNFDIPDGLGLGKLISKGFGGVERMEKS